MDTQVRQIYLFVVHQRGIYDLSGAIESWQKYLLVDWAKQIQTYYQNAHRKY